MASPRPAGPYPIDGVAMPTWLVRFDERGVCVSPGTRAAVLETLAKDPERDVIFFSHGWKTDFGGALEQYGDFLRAFEQVLKDHPADGKRPFFVGITWPSRWLPTEPGPTMAGPAGQPPEVLEVRDDIARPLGAGDAERFHLLAEAASLDIDEAKELAALALKGGVGKGGDELGEPDGPDVAGLLNAWQALAAASGGDQPDDFGDVGLVGGGTGDVAAAGGGFDPVDFLRIFSLFQMKDRAAVVGAHGVAKLLTDLTSTVRSVHVAGHSFGAKVMLSAVNGDPGRQKKPKSLLLLQPALSHLAFAESLPGTDRKGGYRAVPDLVGQPVFSTFSRWDAPLHDIFHLAVLRPEDVGEAKVAAADEPPNRYAALGGYGPRGATGQKLVDLPDPGAPIPVAAGDRVIGLNGGLPDHRIGGHMGVANKFTGWALRQQLLG